MRNSLLVLLAFPLMLTACPQPDDAGGNGAPGGAGAPGGPPPTGGGPVDGAAGAPVDGAAAADAGTTPPTGDLPAGTKPPGMGTLTGTPPSFDTLIAGGETVTINGKIIGATNAQIDFTVANVVDGQSQPEVVAVVTTTDGTFSVKAPAKYAKSIYVSAGAQAVGGSDAAADVLAGAAEAPIKLEGKDVTVEIKVSNDNSWVKKLPWYSELPGGPPVPGSPLNPDNKAPAGAGGAAPAGGTPPAGGAAPAAGGPPTGAPPAGTPPAAPPK